MKTLVEILNLSGGVGMKNRALIQPVEQSRGAEIKRQKEERGDEEVVEGMVRFLVQKANP